MNMLKEYKEMKDKNSNEPEEKSLFDLLDELKNQFGYTCEMKYDELDYIKFERKVDGDHTHVVLLEDHRWERGRPDFNPKKDVGDWLIFSMLTDDERGWFGNYIDSQYPLSYSEYKLFEKIIHKLEERPVE